MRIRLSGWFRRKEIARAEQALHAAQQRKEATQGMDAAVDRLAYRMEGVPADVFAAEALRALRGG